MSFRLARRSIALAVTALAMTASAAGAQSYTVTSTADTVDATPANGVCEAPCTLRGAVQTVNGAGAPGADTIELPAGTYNLAISGADGADPAATGDLDITQDLTITGAGQASTTIDGKGLDRVFDIAGATAEISGVTVTGGSANDGAFTTAGGGIRVGRHPSAPGDVPGTLTLTDSTLTANSAGDGSGVATDSVAAHLTLTRVTVTENTAQPVSSEGGGVNERYGGSVVITDSVIRGNTAQAGGGVVDDGGGTITITGTTIDGNHASPTNRSGGGVFETGGGTVTITRSIISANTANEGAGVIEDGGGTVAIADSWIRDNVASGGLFPAGAGVVKDGGGTLTITGSTISGNRSDGSGGGVEIFAGGPTALTNTTITGNSAATRGGGLHTSGLAVTLTNVTMHDDSAGVTASEIDDCTPAPSCATTPEGVTVRNTIVASGGTSCAGKIVSAGHNIDSGTSCGFTAAGDLASHAPLLGPLADNGGPTQTQALLAGSPAIDAGDPGGCPPADQRGITRPQGAACDIGAFELAGAAAPVPAPPPPVVPPKAATHPTVKASDIIAFPSAKACVSRRAFHIRIRKVAGVTIVSASVSVNGKRVNVIKGKRLSAGVDLRGLPRGRFTVKIALKTSAGKTLTGSRRYRTCTVKHRGHAKPKL